MPRSTNPVHRADTFCRHSRPWLSWGPILVAALVCRGDSVTERELGVLGGALLPASLSFSEKVWASCPWQPLMRKHLLRLWTRSTSKSGARQPLADALAE